jgi:hypothetical protein
MSNLLQFCSVLVLVVVNNDVYLHTTGTSSALMAFDDVPPKMISSRSQDMFVAGVRNGRAGTFIERADMIIVRGRYDVLPICVSNHQIHLNGSYWSQKNEIRRRFVGTIPTKSKNASECTLCAS